MRVNVEKYLVLGPMQKKEVFFARMQQLGIAEFIGPKSPTGQQPQEVQLFLDALHILRQRVPVSQSEAETRSARVLARHVIEVKDQLERLLEQGRLLHQEQERIAVFGHFSLLELRQLEKESHRVIQFFCAQEGAEVSPELIYIDSRFGMDYYMSIDKEAKSYPGCTEIVVERSLSEIEAELAQTRKEIDENEVELATLAHHKEVLQEGLAEALDQYHLQEAHKASEGLLQEELFAVECWIPQNKVSLLAKVADELDLFYEATKVQEEERIPTYLENKGTAKLGQDLVGIYDTPSARDKDPSNWVFFSFGLFFSIIVGDAGYGLILLAISLFFYFKFKDIKGLGKRTILLTMSLGIGCIFWGSMTSSFFGMSIPIESPVRSISFVNWMVKKKTEYVITHKTALYDEWVKEFPTLKDVQDPKQFLLGGVKKVQGKEKYQIYETFSDNVMMELAIFIGTIHIILSFVRYLGRNWSGAGWILFLIGGYLYFPLVLKSISLIHYVFGVPYDWGGQIGYYLIFIGIGLATLLAIIQNKLAGAAEIMQVIGVFADVMSYLRIYALGLAGMIMGATFNDIGGRLPWYVGILIIFAGHTVNFTLALMGGLIHGLRLNFIEWYHYSFEGGGRNFAPLSLLKGQE